MAATNADTMGLYIRPNHNEPYAYTDVQAQGRCHAVCHEVVMTDFYRALVTVTAEEYYYDEIGRYGQALPGGKLVPRKWYPSSQI